MELEKLIEVCDTGIPESATWRRLAGESYGCHHIGTPLDRDIKKVLYCVTPGFGVGTYAVEHGFDATISHHPGSCGTTLPHFVYHTALDCCRDGHNDMWATAIGLTQHRPFDDTLGAMGVIPPTSFAELVQRCRDFAGDIVGALKDSGRSIEKVVICTGLGGMVVNDVEAHAPDCYITGELIQDPAFVNIPNVIEIGHTLSERCGVTMFQKLLTQHGVVVESVPLHLDRFGGETWRGNTVKPYLYIDPYPDPNTVIHRPHRPY